MCLLNAGSALEEARRADKECFIAAKTIAGAELGGLELDRTPTLRTGLDGFNAIILDECHELTTDLVMILLFLKRLVISRRRTDLKIILMSATANVQTWDAADLPSQNDQDLVCSLSNNITAAKKSGYPGHRPSRNRFEKQNLF